MKQKIAFIICGQPRFISLYKEYMSKFLFDLEIDFFFHFWGTQNNEILDILKPKKFEFENQKDFSEYIQTFNKENKNYILTSNKKWYSGESWLAYSLYNFMSNNREVVKGINIFKMPFLLKKDGCYKITQDFEYSFQKSYSPSIII